MIEYNRGAHSALPPAAGSAFRSHCKKALITTKQSAGHNAATGNTMSDFAGSARSATIPVKRRTGNPTKRPHRAQSRLCHQSAFPTDGKKSAWTVHSRMKSAIRPETTLAKQPWAVPLLPVLLLLDMAVCRTLRLRQAGPKVFDLKSERSPGLACSRFVSSWSVH
jgi:hypothetical protein